MNVKCLICERELELNENYLSDGGYINIEFHYGSRHDQCHDIGGNYATAASTNGSFQELLLASDKIEAYICDDCFEMKHALMRAFVVEKSIKLKEMFLSRGQQSLEPYNLNEKEAAVIQQSMLDRTAKPLISIQSLKK